MPSQPVALPALEFHPLTPERWPDLVTLFGERGACGGCWCMWWRLARSEWTRQRGEANKQAFRQIVASGEIPGIIAYADGQPVGWCSVEPREAFPALDRSRTLKRLDDLLRAVVDYVCAGGGKVIEGYPQRLGKPVANAWVYMGLASAFLKAGFTEVARPSKSRSIMRYTLQTWVSSRTPSDLAAEMYPAPRVRPPGRRGP